MIQKNREMTTCNETMTGIGALTEELTRSMRRPGRKTLALIDRALSYLSPFESKKATVASVAEKKDLLELLERHRMVLSPYVDIDRVEWNLKFNDKLLNFRKL